MHLVTGSVPDLPSAPTPEIQAALTTLGHRPTRPERLIIDLTGKHLANARLYRVNLTGAELTRADLTRAELGGADLTGAWLRGANLTGARLGADLTGVRLGADLTYAELEGTNLTGARLGANPSVVPPGWVITDSTTGELRRAAT
jgi:hypothetical protein